MTTIKSRIFVDDLGEFYNAIDSLQDVEFTASKATRDWGLRPDDSWQTLLEDADRIGIDPDDFWAHYLPLLNAAVGWE
jgi:hypothetical protein